MAEINSANSVTGTDSFGNKYTQSVSNDSLTTNDFLISTKQSQQYSR